jgi:magnesium transporter
MRPWQQIRKLVDCNVVNMKIIATQYSKSSFETKPFTSFKNIQLTIPKGAFLWLDVSEYEKFEDLKPLEKIFKLHSLALEDCVNVRQRPKIDDFKEYLFLISRTVMQKEARFSEGLQLGIFLGKDFIVTVHKDFMPQLDNVSEKIAKIDPRMAKRSCSLLLYAVLDAVVDDFEEAVRHVEEIESNVGCDVLKEKPPENVLESIYTNRSNLLLVNRVLRNQSHVVSHLAKRDFQLVKSETAPFFEDVYDHTLRTLDRINNLLEMNMGSLNIYTSSVGHKMNEVMKLLTIISTIGVPMTVLVGWYGMNFREMPEIYWAYGYLAFILIAVGLMAGTILLFRRKGWL